MQTSITSLRKDATDKIQREEDMQIKHLNNINKICKSNYSNSNKIEFEKIVTSRRMKNVKTTGAIHKDTMMSAREYSESKMLVKSVPLSELKINDKLSAAEKYESPTKTNGLIDNLESIL